MKVALSLSCQHPPDTNMRDHLSQHLRQAALAAELGFAGVFSFEHFLLPAHQMLHQTTFLGRVAAEVPGLDVGTGISLAALHNPVELADAAATLDVITGGRFVFGVGLGYRDAEFAAFDVPKAKAGAIFEERVQLIRRLWAEDEVTQQGYGFRLDGARSTLKPAQRPHPPIWVAAKANPSGREVEGHTTTTYSGVEAQTMHEHWDSFIKMLSERGLTDDQIGLILGGNYL